ncbi:MAG: hypothetical protein PVG38_00600 [Gammaproteobacteria bacterium]|jgi:hypothetical protein
MRKSALIAALFSMSALSPGAFAEGADWLKKVFPPRAVEPAATEQVQGRVQPQAPQVPQDVMTAQQEAMKRQEEAFEMQRHLQTQAVQRQREAFEAQQQAEREEFEASQKTRREDFEMQQLAEAEAFKAQLKAQEQDIERQVELFKAQQQAAADYSARMEQERKAPEE